DHRASCLCPLVVGPAVGHGHTGALGFAAADLVGLRHVPAEIVMAHAAQHDHAAAVGQLRVLDFAGIVFVDRVPFETEGPAEPVDGRVRIAITQARDDGAAAGLFHGVPPWWDFARLVAV